MSYALPTGTAAETILKELRERYDRATDAWRPLRANGALNMRHVSGDPWDPKDRAARVTAGRTCLSLDEINQHTNQVVNNIRSNKRGVKFAGKDEKTSAFYADKMREIEYRSHAQIVYTTAAQNAIERGYGFCRLKAKYIDREGERFNQDLWLEEVVNPDSVLPDPDAKRPDSSDMRFCFVHEPRKVAEFKREFPKAQITDFDVELQRMAPSWLKGDDLVLAEYWSITDEEVELLLLHGADGKTLEVFKDELHGALPAGVTIAKRRPVKQPKVCMYLTNGVELLEKTEWPGQYIPIASCYGKVIYVDTGAGIERKIQGMTDLMRDPQMLYAYLRTNEAELVGMTPKTPFIGYVGQFRTRGELWAKVNHEPVPYLEADAVTEATGAQMLPLPQRQPYDPPIQALEILAESAIRSIRSAAGSTPLPSAAMRRGEKSGVALKRIEDLSAMGSYHFRDHYEDMIRHVGVLVEDVLDKFYDTARDVEVRKANDDVETVRINDPTDKKSISTKGHHEVTVSTGPSFESEQEAGSDMADTLIGIGDPEVMRAVLPLAIKLKNLGVVGDELVEIAKAMQPPQVQALNAKEGEAPDPGQVQAENAQLRERLKMAEAAMGELAQVAEGKQAEQQNKMQIADMQAKVDLEKQRMSDEKDIRIQQMRDATALAVAHLNAEVKVGLSAHTAQDEAMARGESMAHEAAQSDMDRDQADRQGQQAAEQNAQQADAQRAHESEMAAQQAASQQAGA